MIPLFMGLAAQGSADPTSGGRHPAKTANTTDYWEPPDYTVFTLPDQGCVLLADLDECILTVYLDGEVFKTYPISGGKSSTPSPVGTWKVISISNWGEGFGGSWIGLNVPWGEYGLHGTDAPWALGEHNVSHGCIRMKDSDVREVKHLVVIGTIVHIKQDSFSFRTMTKGLFGSDVLNVQIMLQKLGFYIGELDGKYGNILECAVKDFQKANELKADGIVGRETYDVICRQID